MINIESQTRKFNCARLAALSENIESFTVAEFQEFMSKFGINCKDMMLITYIKHHILGNSFKFTKEPIHVNTIRHLYEYRRTKRNEYRTTDKEQVAIKYLKERGYKIYKPSYEEI